MRLERSSEYIPQPFIFSGPEENTNSTVASEGNLSSVQSRDNNPVGRVLTKSDTHFFIGGIKMFFVLFLFDTVFLCDNVVFHSLGLSQGNTLMVWLAGDH